MPKKEAAPEEAVKKEVSPKEVSPKEEAPKASAKPSKAVAKETEKKETPKKAVPKEAKREAPSPKEHEVKPSSKAPLGHGVGRRKSAVARVWLKRGKGSIIVNEKEHVRYFDTELSRRAAAMPFHVYPQGASRYDAHVNVAGGGLPSQADAVKLGIARALLEINPEIRVLLRDHGLLTVDARLKERKKYGQKAARRKFQFVKR